MKTPKEVAKELYYTFTSYAPIHKDNKAAASLAVDLLIKTLQDIQSKTLTEDAPEWFDVEGKWSYLNQSRFWKEVKKEIEKI